MNNEDQNLLPNLLLFVLARLWAERQDWYFGVDMAVYHTTGVSPRLPVVPEAFLSLGVGRRKGGKSRRSYVVWEEQEIVPILVLEIVSHQPDGEYDDKLMLYANLGVRYYIIYNPEFWQRDRRQPFEVHKLVEGAYQQQIGEPYWLPEVGMGIGRSRQVVGGIEREILGWSDRQREYYPLPEHAIQQLQQQLAAEQQRTERLAAYLRSLGVDPDNLPQD